MVISRSLISIRSSKASEVAAAVVEGGDLAFEIVMVAATRVSHSVSARIIIMLAIVARSAVVVVVMSMA